MTIAEIIEKAINDNSKRGLSTEAICQHAEFEIKQWLGKQGDSQQWQLKTEDMKNKFIYNRKGKPFNKTDKWIYSKLLIILNKLKKIIINKKWQI